MEILLLKKMSLKNDLRGGYLVCVDKLRTVYGIDCANLGLFFI